MNDIVNGAKILITGASGMVGQNILEHSETINYELLVPSRTEMDLLDPQKVREYISKNKPDLIIHAAGLVGGILGVFALEALDAFLTNAEDNGIFRHPHVTLDVLLTALTTMTVLGAFAGVLPALRALRVQPVEALRT